MRPDLDQPSAQIIPFPVRNRFSSEASIAFIDRRQEERSSAVCSAAFDSWYHAAAIAEDRERPKS